MSISMSSRLRQFDRDPGVGRHEVEPRRVGDDGDLVFAPGELAHFVGHRHAAEAGPKNDDVCHDSLSPAPSRGGASMVQRCGQQPCGRPPGRPSIERVSALPSP